MELLKQLVALWEDAYRKEDSFHMNKIEKCVHDNFTDFGIMIFDQYIESRKRRDIDYLIKVAADNDIERLTRIKGIGIKTAKAIIKAFTDPETLAMIKELRELGLNFREE